MSTDDTHNALDEEREMREHEQEAKDREQTERRPESRGADPFDEDDRKPAPPGPEAQQPRG